MPLLEDLYAKQRKRLVELLPFFYSTSFTTLAASPSTVAQGIPINSDSHFVARYVTLTAFTGAANAQVVATATAPLTIQFLDTSSGRTLFDNAQPVQNVCGGAAAGVGMGSLPFIFPEPLLIKAGGSIQITLSNIGNSTFTRVDVTFPGFKVFKFGASSPADM
jgi:hypothetical protein